MIYCNCLWWSDSAMSEKHIDKGCKFHWWDCRPQRSPIPFTTTTTTTKNDDASRHTFTVSTIRYVSQTNAVRQSFSFTIKLNFWSSRTHPSSHSTSLIHLLLLRVLRADHLFLEATHSCTVYKLFRQCQAREWLGATCKRIAYKQSSTIQRQSHSYHSFVW